MPTWEAAAGEDRANVSCELWTTQAERVGPRQPRLLAVAMPAGEPQPPSPVRRHINTNRPKKAKTDDLGTVKAPRRPVSFPAPAGSEQHNR